MRGIDTNLLVRFIAADDQGQLALVDRMLEREPGPYFVTHVVLAELAWVLASTYKMKKAAIDDALSTILAAPVFRVEREWLAAEALRQYRQGQADFADYLIGAVAQEAGCRDTVTFDRRLAAAEVFTLLE